MYNPTNKATWRDLERAEHEALARAADELAERMDAFELGLCSYAAAIEGGARYEREVAEAKTELTEQATGISICGIAAPMAEAINGFFKAMDIARKAAA